MKSQEFDLTFEKYVSVLPYDASVRFRESGHKRILIKMSHNDKEIQAHSGLNYIKKDNYYYAMLGKQYRDALGVTLGDTVRAIMMEDTSKYQAPMTEELDAVLLSDYDAFEIFESLTPGLQRNIIFTIHKYKGAQTRVDKSLIICENLKRGIRDFRELLKA